MKLKILINNGLMASALFTILLLVSSQATVIPSAQPLFGLNITFSNTPNIEFANIVAGEGNAVYSSIFTYGGVGEAAYPVDTSNDGLANARNWYVAALKQQDFANYLQRAPAPVSAPDGISVRLSYVGGTINTATKTLNWATSAALVFESAYGVDFGGLPYLIVNTGPIHTYVFYASTDVLSLVAADVAEIGDAGAGFASLIDGTTISSSPVSWAGYGARSLVGSEVAMYGAGWVDVDGITQTGSGTDTVYTISTAAILGGNLSPDADAGLSRAEIRVPYPINPVAGGINVPTSNPLPHVTGIFQWDLVHPAWTNLGARSNLQVKYKLDTDNAFPNVRNEFSVDQEKLNNEGILEATFKLTNIGDETASNIEMLFPIGRDFKRLQNAKPMQVMKDLYDLDTAWNTSFNMSITIDGQNLNERIVDYSGWYRFNSTVAGNTTLAFWDQLNSSVIVFDKQVTNPLGGNSQVKLEFTGADGFPTSILDAIDSVLMPKVSGITNYGQLSTLLDEDVRKALKTAFNDTVKTFYDKIDTFVVDTGNFSIIPQEYFVDAGTRDTFYYLFSDNPIASLAPNESAELKFRITNIPVESDTFQFAEFEASLLSKTLGGLPIKVPSVLVNSSEQNYADVLRYIFQKQKYDGRPLSFGIDSSYSFGLDGLFPESYDSDYYISQGGLHRYFNTEGYPFFGFSNGQNLQLADDEAIITATIDLDKQVYNPGDQKTITVNVTNNGDIPAENIEIHVYQATLGRGWQFERTSKIGYDNTIASLGPKESVELTFTAESNRFVGYSPVFAVVEFDSDVGQGPAAIPDFEDILPVDEFEAAGEAHHYVLSTLTGALLVPESAALTPTIQEPRVEITTEVGAVDDNQEFTVTYTIKNTGEADTTVLFAQGWNLDDFEYVSHSHTSPDGVTRDTPWAGYGFSYIFVSNIQLAVGGSVQVSLRLKILVDEATLSPAFARFRIAGESSLGTGYDVGETSEIESSSYFLGLSAGAAAQQQSQKSATEDSSSSSFSSSSSIGASVNTKIDSETKTITQGIGFVGYDALGFLSLMLVPLAIIGLLKRKRS